ncbi:MAG TPA: aminoacyl-tRNA hydrolase [Terriglobales bacterium]
MKLIVGLGNPGIEYQFTPHNVGFLAVDLIADQYKVEVRNCQFRALTGRIVIGSETAILAKPETFMNLSGLSVRELVAEHQIDPQRDLIVMQDEMDFALGTLRLHRNRSSAGHNGIESIISALGTQDFLRIRLGVAPDHKLSSGKDYLLSPFRKAQMTAVSDMLEATVDAIKMILVDGEGLAMNRLNRKDKDKDKDDKDQDKESGSDK